MSGSDEPHVESMVERIAHQVALEICEATAQQATEWMWPSDFVGDVIDRARDRAGAILEAIRRPTEAMVDAGELALFVSGPSADLTATAAGDARLAYCAMIDAALGIER